MFPPYLSHGFIIVYVLDLVFPFLFYLLFFQLAFFYFISYLHSIHTYLMIISIYLNLYISPHLALLNRAFLSSELNDEDLKLMSININTIIYFFYNIFIYILYILYNRNSNITQHLIISI